MGDFLTYDEHYTGSLREGYFTYDDLLNLAVEELTLLHQNYTENQLKNLDFLLDTNFPCFVNDKAYLRVNEDTFKSELVFHIPDFEQAKKNEGHFSVKTPLGVLFNATNNPLEAKIAISELAIDTYSSDIISNTIKLIDYESYIKAQLLSTLLNPKQNFLYRDIYYYDASGDLDKLNHRIAYTSSIASHKPSIFIPNKTVGLSESEENLVYSDLNLTHFLKSLDQDTINHFSNTVFGLSQDIEPKRTNKIIFPLKSKHSKGNTDIALDSLLTYSNSLKNELIKEKKVTGADDTLWLSKNTFNMIERIVIAQSPLDCISHYNQNKSTNNNTLYLAYIDRKLSLKQINNIENIIDHVAEKNPYFNKENVSGITI